jgi:hypothetical protein
MAIEETGTFVTSADGLLLEEPSVGGSFAPKESPVIVPVDWTIEASVECLE